METNQFYIGTSGWSYKHWEGNFYPAGLKKSQHFEFYRQHFETVELNSSFYHLPKRSVFEGWKKEVGPEFVYAVKASRYITHMKKLHDAGESVDYFLENAKGLGKKLGPILFQLPPFLKSNPEKLRTFLEILPKRHRYVFEFRNPTWYNDEIYGLLRKHNCAFCIYELAGQVTPLEVTANFTYVRLHGPGNKYQGSYSDEVLQLWATRCREWREKGDVFVYFDNDQEGYAAYNAITLKEMLK